MFAVAGLWLLFVGVELLDFGYGVVTTSGLYDGAVSDLVRTLLGKVFLALCATCYLLASVRVANTYPSGDAPEVIAQDFE